MNPFDFKFQNPLSPPELVDAFIKKSIVQIGSLEIWYDTVGRPGDDTWRLSNIDYNKITNTLTFHFGSNYISVVEPHRIYANHRAIAIFDASQINWHYKDWEFEYRKTATGLQTTILRGNHLFDVNQSEKAFYFYN
jgi:hypothetical protein